MVAAHEIFEKPFKVELSYEDVETPEHYRKWPGGEDLPPTLKAWRVHADELKEKNYGLVSDPYGFLDSPDCELISGGVNSKGPESVAIGRQGNWFLWGFCAPPSAMTPSARKVFLNAVAYMKRFDGQAPLVKREASGRDAAFLYANYVDEEKSEWARKAFDASLLGPEIHGSKLKLALKENLGFLRHADGRFAIDPDAKALGVANRDPALLERCVAMLEKGEKGEKADLALRLLERYVKEPPDRHDAKGWREWLTMMQGRLYFTDTGGYVWRVGPGLAHGTVPR